MSRAVRCRRDGGTHLTNGANHQLGAGPLVRRLRPSPERFAAAAAVQDPGLLLQLQAAISACPAR